MPVAPAEGKGRDQQAGLCEGMGWGFSVLLCGLIGSLVMILKREKKRIKKSFCCIADIRS